MSITIDGNSFTVEPTYTPTRIEVGAKHYIQNGNINIDSDIVKFSYIFNFTHLTQAEFDLIEAIAHRAGNVADLAVAVVIEERSFVGATTDSVLNRVLNKMKLTIQSENPYTPYASSSTRRALSVLLEET